MGLPDRCGVVCLRATCFLTQEIRLCSSERLHICILEKWPQVVVSEQAVVELIDDGSNPLLSAEAVV